MQRGLYLLALCGVLLGMAALPAAGQVVIGIEGSGDPRTKVAVPPLVAQPGLESIAQEIADVISYDLEFSNLFIVMPRTAYPAGWTGFPSDPASIDFDAWRTTQAEQLVYGSVRQEGDSLIAELRLFDLFSVQQIHGAAVRAERQYPRLLGHRFTEELIEKIDGIAGSGTSEICFVGGPTGNKDIYVADYDGAHARKVTEHGNISLMPAMSPDGQRIAYLSYKDRYAFLYVFDRRTGRSVPLSKEVGLNSAPSWHPNGNTLAMVLSKDANPEIYLRNADGSGLKRLTDNSFLDTSPVFSPDGAQIAFVSDRGGSPQIWSMNSGGSGAQRLSVQGGNSFDPAWSPDGKQIAYVAELRGEGSEIFVMDAATGRNWKRLTNSQGTNEKPSWSPDSRHVVFTTTRAGGAQLYTVHVESGTERPVPNLGIRATSPSWGPRRN
jgi:TolB protein